MLSIESGSQKVLNNIIQKNLSLNYLSNVIKWCNKLNIEIFASYVIGFPGESIKNIKKTIDYSIKLLREYNVTPIPLVATPLYGTQLYNLCVKKDYIKWSINNIIKLTEKNTRITLNMCFNYGGRQEIINAVNKWIQHKKPNESFSEKKIEKYLLTAGLPNIDLMIRTSGEYRISNFLIWQIAYSELIFTDVLWPDFKPYHLYKAIYEFQRRERRYGG